MGFDSRREHMERQRRYKVEHPGNRQRWQADSLLLATSGWHWEEQFPYFTRTAENNGEWKKTGKRTQRFLGSILIYRNWRGRSNRTECFMLERDYWRWFFAYKRIVGGQLLVHIGTDWVTRAEENKWKEEGERIQCQAHSKSQVTTVSPNSWATWITLSLYSPYARGRQLWMFE